LSWTIEELTSLEIIVICGFGLVSYILWDIRQHLSSILRKLYQDTKI